MMRSLIRPFLALLLWAAVQQAVAHPGSGIVADRAGNVYFVDTGSGVWKVDPEVRLTRIPGPAFHWMAIDEGNSLAHVTLPYFSRGDATVTRAGTDPSLLLSSDFPLVVGRDTSLYYPWLDDEGGRDYMEEIEEELRKRRLSRVVRLEVEQGMSDALLGTLVERLEIEV